MKTLILDQDEFEFLSFIVKVAREQRKELAEQNPMNAILDGFEKIAFMMDEEDQARIRNARRKIEQDEDKTSRTVQSLHQKLTFLQTSDS